MAYLSVENLEKAFGGTRVLRDVSFQLPEGETLSVIGSSGSGKTTLLRCLNFLERPDGGVISLRGEPLLDASRPPDRERDLRRKRLHFGLVFQSFNLFPQYTALKNVTLAKELLSQERPDFKENKRAILDEIQAEGRELLQKMGLSDRADHYPSQLSGGQQQRVSIARALAGNPSVILADEPTSALDAENRTLLLELLEKQRETAGILFISHDVAALRALCGTVYVMEHGMLTEQGTMQELLEHPKQAWTKEYAAANHPVSREGWTWTD